MPLDTASRPIRRTFDHAGHPSDVTVGYVPTGLRVAAAWSWRVIVVGVVAYTAFVGLRTFSSIVIPLVIALLIAAPLEQAVSYLARWRIPRALGAVIALGGLVSVVISLAVAAGSSMVSGFARVKDAALQGVDQLLVWLVDGPLALSGDQIGMVRSHITSLVQDNAAGVASGAFTLTGAVGAALAASVVALFALFFFLKDGRGLWLAVLSVAPVARHDRIDGAGRAAWVTLRRYTSTSVFVAFIDAVGIGVGAWVLGLPLVLPITVLVFLLSFVPLFGATASGLIAVAVALFDGGWTTALWMAVIVLVVQQIEGSFLYPWLFGRAASLHPLVILLAISAGTITLGVVGAIIAVPVVAFVNAFRKNLHPDTLAETDG